MKKEDEDKRGGVKDAGGATWWIATKVEYASDLLVLCGTSLPDK